MKTLPGVRGEVRFRAGPATGEIEIVLLHDGLERASGVYTLEEAERFTRQLAEAIIKLNDTRHLRPQKPSIILPEKLN